MPTFIYEGPGHALSLAGRNLTRGVPAELEGRAAEAASQHPDVRSADKTPAASRSRTAPTGLGRYAALKARAKELGLPATGKADELEAAIAAEEARLAATPEGDAG